MRQYARTRLAAHVMLLVLGAILVAASLLSCSKKSNELVPGDEKAAWTAVVAYFDSHMPPADRTKMTKQVYRNSISSPERAEIDLLLDFWVQGEHDTVKATVILLRDGPAWRVVNVPVLEQVER